MTRTFETLGVLPGQKFRIMGYDNLTFMFSYQTLWGLKDDEPFVADSRALMEIYDNPALIVLGEQLTADQRGLLMTLSAMMGIRYLAMDMNGTIGMFTDKPVKGLAGWYADSGSKVWFDKFSSDLVSWDDIHQSIMKLNIDQIDSKTGGN